MHHAKDHGMHPLTRAPMLVIAIIPIAAGTGAATLLPVPLCPGDYDFSCPRGALHGRWWSGERDARSRVESFRRRC